ncbi:MAG: pyridoxal phosphate-dependent aminotransferase [Planctomycetota bacterium]|jgi:histidinol-phosphate/aromatic aminotransferase/cobyric acid decarboxylase-like protein
MTSATPGLPDRADAACFHGGSFFEKVGVEFDDLGRRHRVINADVLDAWFPPAPGVIAALTEHLPWLLRTSPPTHGEGLVRAIARARGVPAGCVLPGAGSSSLVFLALNAWLTPASHVLMLEPTYGEYAHVCERVIGCRVERLALDRHDGYRVDPDRLEERLAEGFDLVVLVNPNNPTGQHIPREALEAMLSRLPARSRCWVDEAYLEYAGADQSLEAFAATRPNVVVCKSLSKVYALSGMRAAYLVAHEDIVEQLRPLTPPWAVSLPAQVAAVHALQATDHYTACHRETDALRAGLGRALGALDARGEVLAGVGNWVLWFPPTPGGPSAAEIARRCRTRGLFVRELPGMDRATGSEALRLAVKDAETQERMLEIMTWALDGTAGRPASSTHP